MSWELLLDASPYTLRREPAIGQVILRYFDVFSGELTYCDLMLECDPTK